MIKLLIISMKMKPMLAKDGEKIFLNNPDYIFEPKLDGYRALIKIDSKVTVFSRNGHDITKDFGDFGIKIKSKKAVIDGEIVGYNEKGIPDFSLVKSKKGSLVFAAFDILEKDDEDLHRLPLVARKKILEAELKTSVSVQIVPFTTDGEKLYKIIEEKGGEGVIAKKRESTYVEGRSGAWLKIKLFKTLDCVIIKVNEKRSVNVGLYRNNELIDVGNIGIGFTEKQLTSLKNGDVIEVKYAEITKDEKIRAGVFLRKREDKDAKECTFEETEYEKKRDFTKTPEPKGGKSSEKNPLYVIQRHDASRLHYDFRLEDEGVLKSWALPKGVSTNPSDKRLAVMVEDHPLDYATFEGVIPPGNYGAGTVSIWDTGRFVNITVKKGRVQPLQEAIQKGHFLIWVKGEKLQGGFAFTRINEEKNEWLLVKMIEEKKVFTDFVELNGHRIEFTNTNKELYAGLKKGDMIDYYLRVARFMLPHIKNRLLSLFRFPNGINEEGFYQKNAGDFPNWIKRKKIKKVDYCYCEDEACIAFLANLVVTPHIWTSTTDNLDFPDKIVFDIDPSKRDIVALKEACITLKKFLESIGLTPFIMTTGGKGYHIVIPIKQELKHEDVRAFAAKIAEVFASSDPEHLTTETRKDRRKDKIYIDINRNSHDQTSVAPYAVRQAPTLPIAKPIKWEELDISDPQTYTILDEVKEDAWRDFDKKKVSIKEIMDKLRS